MAAQLQIQPSFIKYATKAELKTLNRTSVRLLRMADSVGAAHACVMKNINGKNGERSARVQFKTTSGGYISGIYI